MLAIDNIDIHKSLYLVKERKMFKPILFIVIALVTFDQISASGSAKAEPDNRKDFLGITHYNDCEGKDAANITIVDTWTTDQFCKQTGPIDQSERRNLVICSGSTRHVTEVKLLADSEYPAGAYRQSETLWEGLSGPLEGKYIYEKVIFLNLSYLNKCSSILGYIYVTSKAAVLLINDKLDVNVLLSPSGGFEQFKKGCTTICKGRAYYL